MARLFDAPLPAVDLEPVGHGLVRPECVVPTAAGDVYVADWRGGVTLVRGNGTQQSWLAPADAELRPNGIALRPDGSFIIANLGDSGGVWHLDRAGAITPLCLEVDGTPLPPANFAIEDRRRRLWISVSTRHAPRQGAWRPDVADGFIALVDRRGARIVADGLHYTNEVRPDPTGTWLYAIETFGRQVVRFPIQPDASLGAKETIVTLGHGCFPDGFAFDVEGGLWVTSLVSNRLLRFDGRAIETVIADTNEGVVTDVEQAFAAGTMAAPHLGRVPGTRVQQLTSIGFGGADRQTAYIGVLHGDCIYRFRSPVAGVPADI